MQRLPNELQSHILSFLDAESLLACRIVQKKWDTLICTTSTHLKYRLPVVAFDVSSSLNECKPLSSFLEVMKSCDRGQEFPFCKFKFDIRSDGRVHEDWDWRATFKGTPFKEMEAFGKEFGIFVKELFIQARGGGLNNDDKKLCSVVHSLIAQTPNVQFLNLNIRRTDLESFKPVTPFMMLEKLKFRVSDCHLMHLLLTPETCPKLKKLKVYLGTKDEPAAMAVLGKLKEFKSLSISFEVECDSTVSASRVNLDFFKKLQSTTLNLEKLTLIYDDSLPAVLEAMLDWLSTLTSTLQVLYLRLGVKNEKVGIPKLEILKKISINNESWGNLCFFPLEQGNLPNLTTVNFTNLSEEKIEELLNEESVFPTVSHLELCKIGEIPLDKLFPKLEELVVHTATPEDLTFILTRMTQLNNLELGNLASLSALLALGDDSWMLPSSQKTPLPCFGNMKNLAHLRFYWDFRQLTVDKKLKFLIGLVNLSLGKKLRPLSTLVIKWSRRDEVTMDQSMEPVGSHLLQRLRECHQSVRMYTGR